MSLPGFSYYFFAAPCVEEIVDMISAIYLEALQGCSEKATTPKNSGIEGHIILIPIKELSSYLLN